MSKVILYIETMRRGGAERVLNNIAHYLSNEHDVILINDVMLSEKEEYTVDAKVKRRCLGLTGGGVKGNLTRVRRLRKIILEERPDSILSFMGPCNLRMLVATKGLKIRKIVSVRNDPRHEYGGGFTKIAAKLLFRSASRCVFQTQDAMNYFQKSVRKKSLVIWNPVSDIFFERSWKAQREEIAVVGRLVPQKNPLLALDSFYLISSKYPLTKLVYYGSGELKNAILKKAENLNLSRRVLIVDNVPNIEDYISSARLFLMTSDFEGMPNALMEAMTVGLPCVATDCPCGGPKAISSGFTEQMLVPCGNAMAIAKRIDEILSDETKQRELSAKEKERSDLFKTNIVMNQWESCLFKF